MNIDGKTLYLSRNEELLFTRNHHSTWSKPEKIKIKGISNESFIGYFVDQSYRTIIVSMKREDSFGHEDLYASFRDNKGKWTVPENLGATINTSGFEIAPFLMQDGITLIFASNGHPGKGNADLFLTRRLYNSWSVWTKPINLGPKINTEYFEAYMSVGADSTVIFASNRDDKLSDLYYTKLLPSKRNIEREEIQKLILEARSLLKDLQAAPSGSAHVIEGFRVDFSMNSHYINKEDRQRISLRFSEILNGNDLNDFMIELNGNSSDHPGVLTNEELNAVRLQAVERTLIETGIPREIIFINSEKSGDLEDKTSNAEEKSLGSVKIKVYNLGKGI